MKRTKSKQELKKEIDDLVVNINKTRFKEEFQGEQLQVKIIGTYNQDTVTEKQLLDIQKELKVFLKNGISSNIINENKNGIWSVCGQEYPIINWNTNTIYYGIYGD